MIMTENRPTFYAILKAKNEAYEFIMKYMKLDKNLTVVLPLTSDCWSVFPHLCRFGNFDHQTTHLWTNSEARVQ